MEPYMICECGNDNFYIFWNEVECKECRNRFSRDKEELWLRRYNKVDGCHEYNKEKWEFSRGHFIVLEHERAETNQIGEK